MKKILIIILLFAGISARAQMAVINDQLYKQRFEIAQYWIASAKQSAGNNPELRKFLEIPMVPVPIDQNGCGIGGSTSLRIVVAINQQIYKCPAEQVVVCALEKNFGKYDKDKHIVFISGKPEQYVAGPLFLKFLYEHTLRTHLPTLPEDAIEQRLVDFDLKLLVMN